MTDALLVGLFVIAEVAIYAGLRWLTKHGLVIK